MLAFLKPCSVCASAKLSEVDQDLREGKLSFSELALKYEPLTRSAIWRHAKHFAIRAEKRRLQQQRSELEAREREIVRQAAALAQQQAFERDQRTLQEKQAALRKQERHTKVVSGFDRFDNVVIRELICNGDGEIVAVLGETEPGRWRR